MVVNYKEVSDKAYLLHTQNKLDEAEKLYKALLKISPEDANILNLYGLLCISKNDFEKAISLLSQAVILKESAYTLTNLAKAYLSSGEAKNAVKLFEKAAAKKPDDDIYYSLAIAYRSLCNSEKAIYCYKKALELNSNNYNACYNLSILYKDSNKLDEAINYANKCLFLKPQSEEIYSLLSTLYELNNNIDGAIKSLENAALLNPDEYLYFYNLGVLYSKKENIEKSALNYLKVLQIKPDNVETLVNLCSLYKKTDIQKALTYILKARELAPSEKNVLLNLAQIYRDLYKNQDSIIVLKELLSLNDTIHEAYSLLAVNYMDTGRYDKALINYNKALEIMPDNLNYLHGKSTALKYLGSFEEAEKILEYVVSKDSLLVQSATSLGMMYLQKKNFTKGMPLYIRRSEETKFYKLFSEKTWHDGVELKDKKVLVYSDCGLGDTIMFARYLEPLKKIAAKVVLQTDKELVYILSNSFNDIDIVDKTAKYSNYDVVIPIMNLAYALDMDFDAIPLSQSYIKDISSLTAEYSAMPVFDTEKTKVGIFRQGNKRIFKNRFVPPEYINILTSLDNIKCYSMQKDEIECDNITSLSQFINNYSDTASLLKNIDLLITVDSSVVHMAGALGVRTFLLLPYTAEWRWFDDNFTTPWYDSVRIFKQDKTGDWESVIKRVKDELIKL